MTLCLSGVLCYESVRSDKSVCVCATLTVYKPGPQIDLCVFCTFLQYFRCVPCTCSQNQCVLFLSPCSWCTAVLPSTASLPMPWSGWNLTLTEIGRTCTSGRQTPTTVWWAEHQLRMSGCFWCLWACVWDDVLLFQLRTGLTGINLFKDSKELIKLEDCQRATSCNGRTQPSKEQNRIGEEKRITAVNKVNKWIIY